MNDEVISRRLLLKQVGALGLLAALQSFLPSCASQLLPTSCPSPDFTRLSGELIDLVISERSVTLDGRTGAAMTINGTIPRPLIRPKQDWRAAKRRAGSQTPPSIFP